MSHSPMNFLQKLLRLLGLGGVKSESAIVKHVIDGDSVRLSDGREVRYLGVDAPETNGRGQDEPWAERARTANVHLVEGRRVRLVREVSDHDYYGRLLRHVYVGRTWVGGKLVERGLAKVRTYPPDTQKAEALLALEKKARRRKRGIWRQRGLFK